MLRRLNYYLLLLFLFLLPLQTRYIYHYGKLNGGDWEYGTYSFYGTEILLWVIVVFFIVDRFRSKELWKKIFTSEHYNKQKKILAWLAVFFAAIFIPMFLSVNFELSFNYLFHLIEGLCIGVVIVGIFRGGVSPPGGVAGSIVPSAPHTAWWSRNAGRSDGVGIDCNQSLLAFWLGGVVQGLLSGLQFFTQHAFASKWLGMALHQGKDLGASVVEFGLERWLRAYGSFGWPDGLGIYLAIVFVLGLILYVREKRPGMKMLLSVGQIIILLGLLLSFSRGAWLSAIAGIIILSFIIIKLHLPIGGGQRRGSVQSTLYGQTPPFIPPLLGRGASGIIRQLLFSLLMIVLVVVIFFPVFSARFNLQNKLEARSINERKSQYSTALDFIGRKNLFFGVGPGAYTLALFEKNPSLPASQYQPIHNIFLLMLVEFGVLGFVLIIFLFAKIAEFVYKNNIYYLPILAVLLVAGLFDHFLWSLYGGMMVFWVAIGLSLGRDA